MRNRANRPPKIKWRPSCRFIPPGGTKLTRSRLRKKRADYLHRKEMKYAQWLVNQGYIPNLAAFTSDM